MYRFIFALLLSLVATGYAASQFESDPTKVFQAAKKSKKPVLISFYGIWCPPCNEMKETVFETPNFSQRAKGFHLLHLDADAKESWELKSKYKVGGYPTIVFTNPNGEELFRVVGYRSPKEFVRVMDLVLAAKGKDLSKSCKSDAADDLWRCAQICGERKDTACADEAYKKLEKKLKPGMVRYEQARAYFVERASTDDLKRDGYERLFGEAADSPLALMWSLDYLKLFEDGGKLQPKKEPLEKVLSHYSKMTTDPRAEEAGVTPTDMIQIRAILLGKLGRKEEAAAAWKEAAAMLQKLAAELHPGAPARGFTLERISCLEEGGDIDGALKLATEYRAKYPGEFTFHYWTASLLERAKRYNEALPVAKKAYEFAYGDNKIRVATLLVNLYATIPDKESAKKVFEEVSKEMTPAATLEVRTHRYMKKLEDAWKHAQG